MKSEFKLLAEGCPMPAFSGARILHMPILFGEPVSVPDDLAGWNPLLSLGARLMPEHVGKVVYLTVDERLVEAGKTHRRPRLHVDGYWQTNVSIKGGGAWGGGGGGGSWGGASTTRDTEGTGLLTISNPAGCRAWNGRFEGEPFPEGDCEHMRGALAEGEILRPGALYWMSPLCIHESIPMKVDTRRQFVRISLPSTADWYGGCTPNPKGVMPTGRIMPRRGFHRE